MKYTIELDDEELANLREILKAIHNPDRDMLKKAFPDIPDHPIFALETGEWLGRLYNKLPALSGAIKKASELRDKVYEIALDNVTRETYHEPIRPSGKNLKEIFDLLKSITDDASGDIDNLKKRVWPIRIQRFREIVATLEELAKWNEICDAQEDASSKFMKYYQSGDRLILLRPVRSKKHGKEKPPRLS